MLIGKAFICGWNEAKRLDESVAYKNIRLEAIGNDWAVFRDENGKAHAVDFENYRELSDFFECLEDEA